jgi:hypothetical protein
MDFLLFNVPFYDAWGKEGFIHIDVAVVGYKYLSQLPDLLIVIILETISISQSVGYVIPCLTLNEKNLEALPIEVFHCLQEVYNVLKILLFEVLFEELIDDFKNSSFSLIIELNVKMLNKDILCFFFFLMGIFSFGIENFEELDE